MKFKSLLIGSAIAAGLTAGGAAVAHADEIFYGNYRSLAACQADGKNTAAHPGWTAFDCRKGIDDTWNLYLKD
ncbi:hypothetical protein LTV02_00060 [Nocardia yamanashiensis]|uniref:hypothetical protein n=1 Tax=Nocardia yamanashiensis TaxID=209247 RepID=UPI001E388CC3|nr:hypothetical protein [Nocardia yamanashiensis]UGT41864.1 hypothetical protein LTV02_00060 [Nocardia yamanashiensis]